MVDQAPERPAPTRKTLRLRRDDVCRSCSALLPAGTEALWDRGSRTVCCLDCTAAAADPQPPAPAIEVVSRAGASARREHERRKAKDEQRIRERWGRLGGLAVALSDERQSTAAWERGAVGEERLGAGLDRLEGVAVLHDRRIPGTRANIDHLVITGARIWVVDAKHYRGRPELRVEGGLLRPRTEKLLVGRRDRTRLVDGVLRQVDLVRAAVPDVPVTGALCFLGADWPAFGGTFSTRGIEVLWPRRLYKRLRAEPGDTADVMAVRDLVAGAFPPA